MTTVLIFGLILAANGYLENQQEAGARQQIETVGTELATQLEDAARLGGDSQQATLRVDQPAAVMSDTYSVSLEPPGECPLVSSANTCLEVDVARGGENLVRGFPVHNDSNVHVSIDRLDSTTFTLTATRTGGTSTTSGVIPMDQTLSIGIAKGVNPHSTGRVLNPFNRPPIAKFTLNRSFPQSGQTIQFNASNSRDPDGTIDAYHWIFDNQTVSPPVNMSNEGARYNTSLGSGETNVTLKVVDDEGGIGTVSRNITVSGLTYDTGSMNTDPSCNYIPPDAIEEGQYKITNEDSNDVLEVENGDTSDGANVEHGGYNNNDHELWNITAVGNKVYRLTPAHATDKALDVSGGSTSDGANIIQWGYSGGDNQHWEIKDNGDGTYRIIAVHSGDALTADPYSDDVFQYSLTSPLADSQKWKLKQIKKATGGKCLSFTVENDWNSGITLSDLLLNSEANYLENNYGAEMMVDIGNDGSWDHNVELGKLSFPKDGDGTIVEIPHISIPRNEEVEIQLRGLRGGGNPIQTTVGLRYWYDDKSYRTVFEDE
ncbi:PKD domain-containing protein [Halorhabdus sp. BNX81]|nr:PKD domain-containing protein [Halorhabdus sp. BNX81]